jgi:hypothetical protein
LVSVDGNLDRDGHFAGADPFAWVELDDRKASAPVQHHDNIELPGGHANAACLATLPASHIRVPMAPDGAPAGKLLGQNPVVIFFSDFNLLISRQPNVTVVAIN